MFLAYFMVFLPFLLKFLSFLFPLFITISLLLLALGLMYCDISPASSSFLPSTTCTLNETKYTPCIPLVEEGMEVLSTFMLEAKTKVDCSSKNFEGILEVEDVVEVEEECAENVTLCVKASEKIREDNVVNEGGSNFESVSSNVRKETDWKRKIACKLLEQHNVREGEDRMDSLWEIYALLDTYQSDFTIKSAQKAVVVFKKKNKRTRILDYYGNEDDDVQMQTGQPGCYQVLCKEDEFKNGKDSNC